MTKKNIKKYITVVIDFFFNSQDYHDDIRQEQMWEMQAISSTQNQNYDTNNSTASTPENGIISETDSTTECSGGILCSNNSSNLNGHCINDQNLNHESQLVHSYDISQMHQSSNNGGGGMQVDLSSQSNLLGSTNNLIQTNLSNCNAAAAAAMAAMKNDTDKDTLFVDANGSIMHPALRGIKTVNLGLLNLSKFSIYLLL